MAKVYVNRPGIKDAAKKALKGNYGTAIAAILIVGLVSSALPSLLTFLAVFLEVVFRSELVVGYINFALSITSIFISAPLSLGLYSLYIKLSRGIDVNAAEPIGFFKHMLKAVGLQLLILVKVYLWSLLFLIPGIIAMIRYSMAFYIMAENPHISVKDAINQSKYLMEGNKLQYFELGLSFMGWIVLAPFTCGILYFWLAPYMAVTNANFYNALVHAHSEKACVASEKNADDGSAPQPRDTVEE